AERSGTGYGFSRSFVLSPFYELRPLYHGIGYDSMPFRRKNATGGRLFLSIHPNLRQKILRHSEKKQKSTLYFLYLCAMMLFVRKACDDPPCGGPKKGTPGQPHSFHYPVLPQKEMLY
ncbi:MAG: hypothetical protein LUG17_05610, partial [Clostridiales bacterium]|nr:hypothetical protein [Clostridiales bacterium]